MGALIQHLPLREEKYSRAKSLRLLLGLMGQVRLSLFLLSSKTDS
jgi:hypothetical protein